MRLAISSWGLRNLVNRDWPLARLAAECKAHTGIADVELCQQHFQRQDARYLDEVVQGLEEAGGRCVNMPVDVGNISRADDRARAHDLKVIEGWIRVAAYIGCPMVRVNTGGAQDEGALDRVAASYRHLADFGAEHGVNILLENHGGLSNDPGHVQALLERVGGDRLGLCPDFGNFEEAVRYDSLAAMLPHARIVHAKYNQPGADGAQWDWPRCVQIVKSSGFDGIVSIEIGRHIDPWQSIAEALALWRGQEPA
ncbi:MAG TPA: sugar phosphate isomerase/epimerase family protein [Limnochordia bacterium]|nr:sugar phosphate isomerase/epimerase family protein [Limnochordia bacterium]